MTRKTATALLACLLLGAGSASPAGAQGGRRVSVFPSPGTHFASPKTQVSFRGVTLARLGTVTLTGSRTGAHAFTLRAHSDGKGVSALPAEPFAKRETVTVRTALNVRGARKGDFRLGIADRGRSIPRAKLREAPNRRSRVQLIHSRKDLRPARIRVTRRRRGLARGKLFVAPKIGPGHNGPLIFDNRGDMVWFKRLGRRKEADGFQVQRLGGRAVLTWWEGLLNFGTGNGVGKILDDSYHEIGEVRAGNGYDGLDPHEFLLTERGTALVGIQSLVYRNLRSIGGARRAQVFDAIVQEIDLATGLVLFEWHSLDHIGIRASHTQPPQVNGHIYDYFHINSIAETPRGRLVISARNTWGIYKIDQHSGRVRWRLGGKRSSFRMGRGTRFAWQHDARVLRDGTITVFDNAAAPKVRDQSRGIRIRLRGRRARLVKSYRHSRRLLSGSQGNMQPLPNGSFLIGWGQQPVFSEHTRRGREIFSARLSPGNQSYRAFRFPWVGRPDSLPDAVASTDGRTTKLYMSWNGATRVARWDLLAGTTRTELARMRTVRRSGFETLARVRGARRFVAVRAKDAKGRVLATSPVIAPKRR